MPQGLCDVTVPNTQLAQQERVGRAKRIARLAQGLAIVVFAQAVDRFADFFSGRQAP